MPSQPRFREPGYSPGPQPGFAPSGTPAGGYGPNGAPASGGPVVGGPAVDLNEALTRPLNGGLVGGGPVNAGPLDGGPASWRGGTGGPEPGGQYRLPNGRRVPHAPSAPFRPPGPAGERGASQCGAGSRPGPARRQLDRAPRPQAPSCPPPGADRGPQASRRVPPGPSGTPGPSGPAGPMGGGPAPGSAGFTRSCSGPAEPVPREWVPVERVQEGSGAGGPRADGRGSWERLQAQAPAGGREGSGSAEREGPAGPVDPAAEERRSPRNAGGHRAGGGQHRPGRAQSFARDLRALRAGAQLDYPEMAEASHYEMKTLASAAGGLRLPTLPVAVAYVRACGGNLAEWEDRWQKLAADHRGSGEETAGRRRRP